MENIPYEIIQMISYYLDPFDLINLRKLDHKYRNLIDESFWKEYLTVKFNVEMESPFLQYATSPHYWIAVNYPCRICWKGSNSLLYCYKHIKNKEMYAYLRHSYYSRYSKKAKISIRNNISIRLSEYKDEELKWHIKHLDNRMIDMKLDWKDEKYIFFDLCIECWENARNRSCIHSFCKKCCKCKLCPVH